MDIAYYIIAGALSGVVAGMGMGGGTLLIPALTIFLSFSQQDAQGINLLAFLPAAVVALIIHAKEKLVSFKSGLPIVLAGVAFSVGAGFLATEVKSDLLKFLFGCFLLAVAVFQMAVIIVGLIKKKRKNVYKFTK